MAFILVWGHRVQVLGMGQPYVPGYSVSGHPHDAPAVQGTDRDVHTTSHLQVYFRYSTLFMAAGIIHRTVWLPEGLFQVQQCCCATDIFQVQHCSTGSRYISGTAVLLCNRYNSGTALFDWQQVYFRYISLACYRYNSDTAPP